MDADLTPFVAALAELTDDELERLIAATYGAPQTAPGLLAWIDGACECELNRRRGNLAATASDRSSVRPLRVRAAAAPQVANRWQTGTRPPFDLPRLLSN